MTSGSLAYTIGGAAKVVESRRRADLLVDTGVDEGNLHVPRSELDKRWFQSWPCCSVWTYEDTCAVDHFKEIIWLSQDIFTK
jgi:hypothetical protein